MTPDNRFVTFAGRPAVLDTERGVRFTEVTS
jgi:hypothetical protein